MLLGTLASPGLLSASPRDRRDYIARIVDNAIDHVFVADHVSFHVGTGMDGLINAATLCALDERLRVCVGVYLLALRHPVTVARQLATLAESAPGQLIFGVGVGGEDRNEIAMCGVDPASRGRRTDECLDIVQCLLKGEPLDHTGEFFDFQHAWIQPPPQPAIPFLIGGRADAAIARAARFGDGWLGVWTSAERFANVTTIINDQAAVLGRDIPNMHGMQIWAGIDNDRAHARARLAKAMERFYRMPFERFEKYSPYGSIEEVVEYLAHYRAAGCEVFNIMAVAESETAAIDALGAIRERLALQPDCQLR